MASDQGPISIFESATGSIADAAATPDPTPPTTVSKTIEPKANESGPTTNDTKSGENVSEESKNSNNSSNSSNSSNSNNSIRKPNKNNSGLLPKSVKKMGSNMAKQVSGVSDTLAESGSKLLESYDDVLTRVSHSTGIQFAPVKIPLARRRQTFAVLIQTAALFIAIALNFIAFRYWTGIKFYLYLLYLTYKLIYQTFHKDGGLPIPWFRSLTLWKWFVDFFPVTLHKTCDLDKSGNTSYVFGYHPHGIIGMGAWATFASVGQSGFTKLFPNVDVRLLTLRVNFYIPFFDLFLTFMGICDASRESCNAILGSEDKKSLALVLGGAKESLDAHPGKVVLYLRERKGFVKIALEHGATLVPVFGFGENELYFQLNNPQGSLLRRYQEKLQSRLGFAIPIFRGRGVFQYNFGLLPRRYPIHVLFGEPIKCPKIKRSEITNEILNKYHALYMIKLKELFDHNKHQFYENPNQPPPELQFR